MSTAVADTSGKKSVKQKNQSSSSKNQEITRILGHHVYDKVSLGEVKLELDKSHQPVTKLIYGRRIFNFRIRIFPVLVNPAEQAPCFTILRNYDDFVELDYHIHTCSQNFPTLSAVTERRLITKLDNIEQFLSDPNFDDSVSYVAMRDIFAEYITRIQQLMKSYPHNGFQCNETLNWFCLDNMGRHITVIHEEINQPGLYTAQCVKEYVAQCQDELSMKPNDPITVLKICQPSESGWWFGKNKYNCGYFPYDCIKLLPTEGDRSELLDTLAPRLTDVGRKHGKKILTLKELLEKRPKEEELRRKKILKDCLPAKLLKEYVDPADKIPWLVEVCVKYISKFGVVSGIYRKPGSIINVELLRHLFEREKIRVTADDLVSYNEIKNDQYCVASFLKSFFRELKEPLITTPVFKKCEDARINCKRTEERKDRYIQALQGLTPEHWNTLKYLATHLYELSREDHITNMNAENLARIWTSNLIRRDDLNSIIMPNANLETIVLMKSNVCADSDVLTDIIRMVPEIFGYKVPTPDVDKFIEAKAKFVLHNVGPRDDSSLPRCNTVSELGDSGVEYDPYPKLRRRTSTTCGKSQSTSHLPSATSFQTLSTRFGEKAITPEKQHSPGDITKIFEEKENINTSASFRAKNPGPAQDTATYHPLAQPGDGITPIGVNHAHVLKNSSARNSLNNDDDVINEGSTREEAVSIAAPRQGSLKAAEDRQSMIQVENF